MVNGVLVVIEQRETKWPAQTFSEHQSIVAIHQKREQHF